MQCPNSLIKQIQSIVTDICPTYYALGMLQNTFVTFVFLTF